MPRLIVNPGTDQSWEIPLPPGATIIGSDPAVEFPIAHETVAPAHCEISVAGDVATVKDLGSACGTFVNNAPVTESTLAHGQTIHLGEVEVKFESDARASAGAPPVPQRIRAPICVNGAAAAASSANTCCKYHPKALASWNCPVCRDYFCDICVNIRGAGASVRHLCRKCGNDCAPVSVEYIAPVEKSFFQLLPGVFKYPLQGDGSILLGAGAVFLVITGFVSRYASVGGLLLGIFVMGYLFSFMRQIVAATANGSDNPPDWPDFSNFSEDILAPCLQGLALWLMTFGPAIALLFWHPFGDDYAAVVVLIAAAFGALLAPMGMLALAMFDTIGALNPVALVWSVSRIPGPYFLGAAVFELVIGAYPLLGLLMRSLGLPSLLTGLILGFIELYVLTTGMRILGLLYRCYKERLAWF